MITKKQIKTIQPGQWIRVFFDDVGVRDVVAIESGKETVGDGLHWLTILDLENGREIVDLDQIVAISNIQIQPPRY